MNRSFSLIVLAVMLFLPSCVQWNIGENILTARETHVALDYTHPVDGKLYRVDRKGSEPRYYARLPEVRYRVMPALVKLDMYDFKGYEVIGAEPTGREAFAEVKMDEYSSREAGKRAIGGLRREVAAIPPAALAQPYAPERAEPLSPKTPAQRDAQTAPGPTRRAVATALSYTIDPALTIVSTTAFTAAELAAIPFLLVYSVYAAEPVSETSTHHSPPSEP